MRNEFGMKKTEEMFSIYKMSSLAFFYGTIMSLDWQSKEEENKTMEFVKLCQDYMLEHTDKEITFSSIYSKFSDFNHKFAEWCHEREHDIDYQFQNIQSIISGIYTNEKEEEIDISRFMNMKNVIVVSKDE